MMLFVYNFKHKKSVEFIYKLIENNFFIDVIVAANYVNIKRPQKIISFSSFFNCNEHPMDVARKFNIPYFELSHNDDKIANIIDEYSIDLGVIAGARVLKDKIIKLFDYGVVNFHPALLPECRGLDSMFWSIYKDLSLGVTSHLINEKIDCGKLILKSKIQISSNDNLFSINKKIYNLQLDLIEPTLEKLLSNCELTDLDESTDYNSYMPELLQKKVMQKLVGYINNFSYENE